MRQRTTLFLALQVIFAVQPGELHHAALSDEWPMAMPRILGGLGGKECTGRRLYLFHSTVEIFFTPQHAQPSVVFLRPGFIQIDQRGADLRRAVIMNAPVLARRPFA